MSLYIDKEVLMSPISFKQAKRRYHLVFWPMIAIYVVACLGGALIQRQITPAPIWLAPILAFLTVVPMLAVLVFIWRYVQETDEYSRMRQLEALAIGGLVTAGAAGFIGFLQIYDAIPTFPVVMMLPFFFISFGLAKIFRGDKECV